MLCVETGTTQPIHLAWMVRGTDRKSLRICVSFYFLAWQKSRKGKNYIITTASGSALCGLFLQEKQVN